MRVDFTPANGNFGTAFKTVLINVKPLAIGGPANLIVTTQLARDPVTNEVIATLTLANSGGTTAGAVQLSRVGIGATSTTTPLPISLGNIVAGGQAAATVRVPAAIGAAGSRAVLSVAGLFAGSSFGSNIRVVLP